MDTLIRDTLIKKSTIAQKSTRKMTGADLGAELYAEWKLACEDFWKSSYDYEQAKSENLGEESEVDNSKVMDDLKVLLDMIGEVNGHKLRRKADMLARFTPKVYSNRTELTGNAKAIAESKREVAGRIRNIKNGMTEEYIESLHKEFAELEEELKQAKKKTGSGQNGEKRASFETYRGIIEDELAKIIQGQAMTPRAILDAQEEERKAERKRRQKEARQAAAKAKKEAEANA